MTEQRVTLLEHNGWANQAGRYVDLTDGAAMDFAVAASTIEAVRIGDWVVDRTGEITDAPLVITPGPSRTFAAEGTYHLSLKWTTA